MQVTNQNINNKKNPMVLAKSEELLCPKVKFGQAQEPMPTETKSESKKHVSIFSIIDMVGASIGLAAMAGYLIMQYRRPKAQKLVEKFSKIQKKTENLIVGLEEKEVAQNNKTKTGIGFKIGRLFNKWSTQSEQLLNNIVYGVGSLIVAPLVISFAPTGGKKKKESSKEDKFLVILQRYISFGALFAMQVTVDRFLAGIVPKFVKQNAFEKNYKDKEGKLLLDNIRFNSDSHKNHFVEEMKKIGISAKDINDLFKLEDFATIQERMKQIITPQKFERMSKKLDRYFKAKGKEKLLTQTLVVVTNVLFSIPIGGSLLNILFGKTAKAIKNHDQAKEKAEGAKGVSFKGKIEVLKETSQSLQKTISELKSQIPEEKESKIMGSVKNLISKFANSKIFKKIIGSEDLDRLTYLIVFGNAANEAMRTVVYTGQSMTNQDLEPDKRKFVGGYNLANGVVSTILCLGVGLVMVKAQKKMVAAMIGGEKAKKLPGYLKAFAGMTYVLPMIAQTILIKRIIGPAIAIPFAGKMTDYLKAREDASKQKSKASEESVSVKKEKGS